MARHHLMHYNGLKLMELIKNLIILIVQQRLKITKFLILELFKQKLSINI